jgi:hypothetical protein
MSNHTLRPRPHHRAFIDSTSSQVYLLQAWPNFLELHDKKTWATVLAETNDILGVLMFGHTLRGVGTRYPFTVIVTSRMQQDEDIIRLFKVAGITIQRTQYEITCRLQR